MHEASLPARRRQPRLVDVVLDGERVRLRPLRAFDAEPAFDAVHRRREILDWLVWPGPDTVDDLLPVFAHWAAYGEEGDNYHFAVVDRADLRFAGSVGVRFAGHPGAGQVGYWLARERWGRGLASEAVGLLAHLAFGHLAAGSLYATVFAGNAGSRRVLEKNGFEDVTGTGRVEPLDDPREQWSFELARERWLRSAARIRPAFESVETER